MTNEEKTILSIIRNTSNERERVFWFKEFGIERKALNGWSGVEAIPTNKQSYNVKKKLINNGIRLGCWADEKKPYEMENRKPNYFDR